MIRIAPVPESDARLVDLLADRAAELPDAADAAPARFLLATRDGHAAGCCGLTPVRPGVIELSPLYVSADERATGVGRALLAAAERLAGRLGAIQVELDTAEGQLTNVAVAGYRPIDTDDEGAGAAAGSRYAKALDLPPAR